MNKKNRIYIIYDGRARENTENATILETCDTLKEAIEDCKLFLHPFSCDPVVYSYDNSGECLTDEQLEYIYWSIKRT